jgi:superfamily I DNA/RNA helicase
MSWEDGIDINSPTYEFITAQDEVIRSVAGPGTGKSFAIKRRIAKLISEGNDPNRILAVTFTRTAASDLKKEISNLSIDGSELVTAKTLHSLCMQFLFREDILSDLSRKPRIMFSHEIKTMLHDIHGDSYGKLRDKEDKVRAYEAAWARLQHDEPGFSKNEIETHFENELIQWMKFHDCLLIGEVIPFTLKYLQDNPHSPLKTLFDTILIDEYQDLNKAEQELLIELSDLCNIVIVGDDDQSIYSFKFAHPEGIREIPDRYNECRKIDFSICRRCPKKIVELANNLIQHNTDRTLDNLIPFPDNDDGIVNVIQWDTLENEIFGIAEIVAKEINNGLEPEDILILTPRRLIGYELRDIINSKGIQAKSYFRENSLPSEIVRYAFSLLYYTGIP